MKKKQAAALGVAVVLAASSLSGCGKVKSDTPIIGNIVGLEKNQIFKIEDLICKKPEYMLVFMDMQNRYKNNLGGSIDWNAKVDAAQTLEDYIRQKTKEDITARYTMAALAQQQGVALTEEETKEVNSLAETYFETLTTAEQSYTGASLEDVISVYTNYLLADKLYDQLTESVGETVSDEESRVIKIQYIRMGTDKHEKSEIKSTFKEVTNLVKGGYQEFSKEAKQYSDDDSIEKILKKNEIKEKYETESYKLSDKEISATIKDGNNYYLIYCVNSYMKEETEENKQAIIKTMKQAAFDAQYDTFVDTAESDFNTSAWKALKLSNSNDVKTDTLLSTYNTRQK